MNDKIIRPVRIFILIGYTVLLFRLTVFRSGFDVSVFTNGGLFANGKLFPVPFVHMKWAFADYHPYFIRQLLENIVMFIPIGVYLRLIFGKKMTIGRIVLIGFLLSLAIESMQYAFGTGESETDDLIVNTLSAFIGGEICIICENHLKNKRSTDNQK
ncbi:MAG: VanZ family protein [Clostridia bacterium]|nr:VanZ family protein [Clostridia bacterium]